MVQEKGVQGLEFQITCTEREYKKAYRMVQWRMGVLRYWPMVLIFSCLSFFTGLQLIQKNMPYVWATLFLWTIAFVALIGYLVYGQLYIQKRVRHYWHFYREFGPVKTLSVHRNCFLVSTDSLHMPFDFIDFRWLIDRKDFYLLIENQKCFILIPKRDVPPEQREIFQKFLHHSFKNRFRTV